MVWFFAAVAPAAESAWHLKHSRHLQSDDMEGISEI